MKMRQVRNNLQPTYEMMLAVKVHRAGDNENEGGNDE